MYRKNKNRGYRSLYVWKDAKKLFGITTMIFRNPPFEYGKIYSNQLASVDSVHRNIAEGYCRRGIKEYIQFLYIALASLGEAVSASEVYHESGLISEVQYEEWDKLAFKMENGLLRLIKSLQQKREDGDWNDTLMVEESNVHYDTFQ